MLGVGWGYKGIRVHVAEGSNWHHFLFVLETVGTVVALLFGSFLLLFTQEILQLLDFSVLLLVFFEDFVLVVFERNQDFLEVVCFVFGVHHVGVSVCVCGKFRKY